MAHSKSYFSLRRGSTKTQTFSVLNGQQITKDRVEGGRNPRTPEQMAQRMCMATASAAYALMKQIVDHSFEGVTYGGKTMSEFISVNADALRRNYLAGGDAFAYNYYRDRALYPGAYVMSRGSASPINVAARQAEEGLFIGIQSGSAKGYQILINDKDGSSVLSADSICAALGVSVGDMATVCVLFPQKNVSAFSFSFLRIRFLAAGAVELTAENINTYFAFESIHPLTVTITNGMLQVDVTPVGFEPAMPGMSCVIHSLKTNSGWLRSDAIMVAEEGLDVSPSAEDALASYPVGPSYVLNGGTV